MKSPFARILSYDILSRMGPLLVWMAAILAGSVTSTGLPAQQLFDHADKLIHFMIYIPLGYLFVRAWRKGGKKKEPALTVVWAGVFSGLYGLLMELIQYRLPQRSFEWMDGLADLLGAMLGAAVYLYYRTDRAKGQK